VLPAAVSAILLIAALAFGYGSTLPLAFFQRLIVDLGLGSFASYLTPAAYGAFVRRFRDAAVLLGVSAIATFALRSRLSRASSAGWTRLSMSARALARDAARAIRAEPPANLGALAVMTLAGAIVRARWLSQPMREDESLSFLFYASKPLIFAISVVRNNNNHLLHTVLVHFSCAVLGSSPWAIRLPACAAGVMMIPAAYLWARIVNGPTTALFTASLIAGSSILIEFSANARGYTLLCLCVLATLAAASYAARTRSLAAWAVFVISAAAGFYTMPLMLYPFGSILIWLAWSWPREWRRCLVATVLTGFFVALLYLPAVAVSGPSAIFANPYVVALPWHAFVRSLRDVAVSTWSVWNRDLPELLKWSIAAGFVVGQFLLFVRPRADRRLPIATAVFSAAAMLLQRIALGDRIWLFMLPLYLEASVAGLVSIAALARRERGRVLPPWCAPATAVGLCLWLSIVAVRSPAILESNETGILPRAEAITDALEPQLAPHDAVYANAISKIVLQYYFLRHHVPDTFLYPDRSPHPRQYIVINDEYGDTPASVLKEYGLVFDQQSHLRLLGRFGSAGLYELGEGR